ncbi:3-oxoacyl-ACP synthase III family protein [Fibrobacter succinogenes]|uniref:3-oxoacyl-[acyl-carrier-protein] synthase-3 n=1 Tax=Fibrobacter succinogenes TaxID=833 RepID=A0A380S4I7_FIBSU|nr:ketoacyl-ACP synthase III [Fibrobacter succinogenes]PWJ35389.1 3-oxoacyl-[acyl-carrier-protein] synthase-3 [Fibrobacter succinogenes subsp. elongatus]SUQ24045.1 3-oxoacyl-[acyl-carrier-protein] synthase-3 [Fibrobacter succinogenes]
MAFFSVNNVAIRGISACVPPKVEENRDIPFYSPEEAEQIIKSTGIERKHVVEPGVTNLDLCEKAFYALNEKLGWELDSIDAVFYATQTEDYVTPPNVFVIHDRLNLSENCLALDINHGCPGWVVGLSAVASMLSAGCIKRAVFFAGDNCSSVNYKLNRETRPLMGDCGTCTALEYDVNAKTMNFQIGTDSKDHNALIRKYGRSKYPHTEETFKKELGMLLGSVPITIENSDMDGASVFSFGISKVPKSIKDFCARFNLDIGSLDKVVLHQANQFMLDKIAKKIGVDKERVPSSLRNYGNTSCASIPLTIVSECGNEYASKEMNTIGCGFGTGLSWGTFHIVTDKIACPEVVLY